MIKGNNRFLRFMRLFSLGFTGGTIWLLMYVRYCFYDQMKEALDCTNAQLGFLNTAWAVVAFPLGIIGAYLADKYDAKNIILLSIGGMTAVTFIYGLFSSSYTASVICWIMQGVVTLAYWPCLVKYINNLGDESQAGSSFGMYYLINGLAGAFGNAFPLWIVTKFDLGYKGIVFVYGGITLFATILVWLFLENEKQLSEKGVQLKGDEPIRLKHVAYVIKWPGLYIMFFAFFTAYTLYSNVSYFTPYLTHVVGIDPDASSMYAVIRSYGAMVIAPIGGIMADKVLKSTSSWNIIAFAISAMMFAVPFLFNENSNVTLVCIYSVLPSLIIFALYSVTYSLLREMHIPATVTGTVIGISYLSGNIVDAVFPAMFGSWIDKFGNKGYTYIFMFFIAICILGILNSIWAKRFDKQVKAGKKVLDLSGLDENA